MVRITIISLFLTLGMGVASAQVTMSGIIKTLPEQIAPYLNSAQREELAHDAELRLAVKAGEAAKQDTMLMVKNVLEGQTGVDSISDDFVRIALTEATELQVRLLSCGDTAKMLCVVKTINVPLKESDVAFYDTDWRKLNVTFGLPSKADVEGLLDMFVLRPDTMSDGEYIELRGYFEPVVFNVDASRSDGCLRLEMCVPIVPSDKKDKMKALLRPVLFKWDGENFKKC